MASNVGEMSGMKDARHMILWLFFGLLPMLGSCDFRDMLDDYPVSGVQIKLDWKGVTDKLPQTMRIIFYPKDTQGRKVESYLPAGGGEVKVPPGKYAVVAYNFNTESIQIRGDESYETIEAFTGHCTGLDVHEDMVWSPDPLYVVALDEVEIRQSDVALPLNWKPEAVVDHYSFDIKVEGWDRISSIICHVDGLNGSYFIGNRACHLSEVPICVDTKRENGLLWGHFSSFVLLKDTKTRADSPMLLTLRIVKRDKTVQEVKVDILEGLLKALDHIDEVIHIIRASANAAEAKKNLMWAFLGRKSISRFPYRRTRLWWMIWNREPMKEMEGLVAMWMIGMMRRMWSYR